jgi:hypothetical protein
VTRAKAVIVIKPTAIGMERGLHPVVPFAIGSGLVACRFEYFCNDFFIDIQSFSSSAGTINPTPNVVSSRKDFGSGRRAYRTDKKAVKSNASLSELVYVGGGEIYIAVETKVTPTLIVGQN